MYHGFAISILFLIFIGKLENVYGFANYKWVPLKSGDKLPDKKLLHSAGRNGTYIGRARHFDEILSAEIYPNGSAFISSCHKEIPKEEFEILTIAPSNECLYKSYSNIGDINETTVHVGTAWDGEPIYVGCSISDNSGTYHAASIYLTKNVTYTWFDAKNFQSKQNYHYLSCTNSSKTKWIDTSAKVIPNNTVSGGKSEIDYKMYVAQLKHGCEVVTGQVIPKTGTATAYLNNGTTIEAAYCQVLVGEPGEYKWVSATNGAIPDYAVVNGRYGNDQQYIARVNKSIGHLTQREAVREKFGYDILVTQPSL